MFFKSLKFNMVHTENKPPGKGDVFFQNHHLDLVRFHVKSMLIFLGAKRFLNHQKVTVFMALF